MANEITLSVALQVAKGSLNFGLTLQNLLATMAGNAFTHKVISVGTVKETLDLGDIATPGAVLLYNLDPTNYIDAGADADSPFIRVQPGRVALFEAAGAVLSVKAHTAACLLEYVIVEA